jgi:hypothetical protein
MNGGWLMLGNGPDDSVHPGFPGCGDCVAVTFANIRRVISKAIGGHEVYPGWADVLAIYRTQNPQFDPSGDPGTTGPGSPADNGMDIQTLLEYLVKNPGPDGSKLVGFAAVDHANAREVQAAIAAGGVLWLGINVQEVQESQFDAGRPWDYVKGSPVEGGHSIVCGGYGAEVAGGSPAMAGDEKFVTWCVDSSMRILTSNLHWIPAGDLQEGDGLLAFDEENYRGRSGGRLYRRACVESAQKIVRPCYDLEFNDGTKVRCSAEHKWLVHTLGNRVYWLATEDLRLTGKRASRIIKPLDVWDTGTSREAGYLAAAFDGKGDFRQQDLSGKAKGIVASTLGFTQANNAMLAETERCLKELEFNPKHYVDSRAASKGVRHPGRKDIHRLHIYRKPEILRFLGSVRPARLLDKFHPELLGRLNISRTVQLTSKVFVGEQEVIALQTDTRTFFAEGLASHNSEETSFTDAFWAHEAEELWFPVWEEQLNTAEFQAGVDLTAFAAEFQAITGKPFPVPVPPAPAPAPVPVPVPPAPVPAPPGPVADPADQALNAVIGDWPERGHVGANERVARALAAWQSAKGFT